MDFKTNEGALELLKSVNGLGNENCYFVAIKDGAKEGLKYAAFGAVGGAVASFSAGVLEGIEGFDGLLINVTENGMGLIPLRTKGLSLSLNPEKMEAKPDGYRFIPNDKIETITIKNYNILNKKVKRLKIKFEGNILNVFARINEKNIPYQAENFTKFINKYNNK